MQSPNTEPTTAELSDLLASAFVSPSEKANAVAAQPPGLASKLFAYVLTFGAYPGYGQAPVGVEIDELTAPQRVQVAQQLHQLLAEGLRAEQVDAWWQERGRFEHSLSWSLRQMVVKRDAEAQRQQEVWEKLALRVLFFFDDSAKFLTGAFGEAGQGFDHDIEKAYTIPIRAQWEAQRDYLAQLETAFEPLRIEVGAIRVKVICGTR